MSLYLGKAGRNIVEFTIKHPLINNAADKLGNGIAALSGGRYRTGLARLAYTISQQLTVGDKIMFLDGKILNDRGKVLVKDKLLKINKAFGEIPIRDALSTPEGMASFLRYTYFKPERWGIHISDGFSDDTKAKLINDMKTLNKKLGIKPNKNIPLSIIPVGNYLLNSYSDLIQYLAISNVAAVSLLFDSPYSIAGISLFIALLSGRILKNYILWKNKGGAYIHQDNKNYFKHGSIELQKMCSSYVFPHEYIHFLKDHSFIKNDIITETCRILVAKPFSYKNIYVDNVSYSPGVADGQNSDPLEFIRKTKIFYFNEVDETYRTSAQLAGLAIQLSERLGEPESKWEFVSIVGSCTDKKELLKKLKKSRFKECFASVRSKDRK